MMVIMGICTTFLLIYNKKVRIALFILILNLFHGRLAKCKELLDTSNNGSCRSMKILLL